jgi:outer membrane protein TolC
VNTPVKKTPRRIQRPTGLHRSTAIFLAAMHLFAVGCQVSSTSAVQWLPTSSAPQAINNAVNETETSLANSEAADAIPGFEISDSQVSGAGLVSQVDGLEPSLQPAFETDSGDLIPDALPTPPSEAPRPGFENSLGEYLTEESTTPPVDNLTSIDTESEPETPTQAEDAPVPPAVVELPWSSGFPTEISGIDQLPRDAWPLMLDEAIQLAFENTTVLRSLGAQILGNPEATPSAFDPWIVSSDPRSGSDAALADFDANLNGNINYANNDDVFNSSVIAGGSNQIQQDLVNSFLTWQKFTSTGTQYSLTGAIDYDDNTRPTNLFPSIYNTRVEAQVRQPLLQGRGELFNSIAGPTSRVDRQGGTGILIAQANVDVSVVQFERNVTTFVNEVISAYWSLHLAYQNVEIARVSFEQAEKTWQVARARKQTGLEGGEAYREALAREQRDRLEVELLDSIHSTGQTGPIGLLQADAQLRLLLNLPGDGQTLLYPVDDPIASATVFDAGSLKQSALHKRAEVREQNIRVERDQMQLLAATNFLLPRLDAVAIYRNNGFGDTFGNGDSPGFESAIDVAADGLYDEWEIGLQYNMTLGARRAKAGVRNSRLRLRRSRQLLKEIEDRIHFDVETALRSVSRSELTFAAARRLQEAARESYDSHQAAFQSDLTTIDELLRSQQRFADAQRTYNRQLIDRTLAIEGVFRETGSLLEMHGVMSECGTCANPLLSNVTTQ